MSKSSANDFPIGILHQHLGAYVFQFRCRLYNQPNQCEDARYKNQHRAFVLTDMSNEPDDQMSLVRLLTYANEIDIVGIAGITSIHKNDSIDHDTIREVIHAYGNVTDSLNAHVPASAPYPSSDALLSKLSLGHPVYGLESLKLNISDAGLALIKAGDEGSAEKPLWIQCWGGASVVAEALNHVQKTRSAEELSEFIKKLRVYSISDQDDAGAWIRVNFPRLFYVVSIHAMSEYGLAGWSGISGEQYRHFELGGPDSSLVTNEWLEEHVRVGTLGAHYPVYTFIMEGDTPAYLGLIQNGLGDPEHPEWGNWGGRHNLVDKSGRYLLYSDAADWVVGMNNVTYLTRYGTIWRWRREYQYDFAARMQWTLGQNSTDANHAPVAIINGSCGPEIIQMTYKLGDSIVLDASESWDPDSDQLSVTTTKQGGTWDRVSKNITIENVNEQGSIVKVTPQDSSEMHLILQLEDDREMELTTYRRVILYPEA
ncbi:DUF1593-domain-containing protein [Corynespora cassiicola Philippines]|uniref:DUF1593-domain-containing protein n=1 Tax=Corynespora cassiicola Philippines TaxID=1448308 RepID=A0A2T2PA25_CORCC|nr:DUF1593-domain-containing protein [Corynespora cassiicola Philippines]